MFGEHLLEGGEGEGGVAAGEALPALDDLGPVAGAGQVLGTGQHVVKGGIRDAAVGPTPVKLFFLAITNSIPNRGDRTLAPLRHLRLSVNFGCIRGSLGQVGSS